MPRHRSPNSRSVVLPIRFNESELNGLAKQAGSVPLSTWIRERALDASHRSPAGSESELVVPLPLEGGAPAPLPNESYMDYQRRLDIWAVQGLTDHARRVRLEIATKIGVQYGLSRH